MMHIRKRKSGQYKTFRSLPDYHLSSQEKRLLVMVASETHPTQQFLPRRIMLAPVCLLHQLAQAISTVISAVLATKVEYIEI
jgi:hypothetical protein